MIEAAAAGLQEQCDLWRLPEWAAKALRRVALCTGDGIARPRTQRPSP